MAPRKTKDGLLARVNFPLYSVEMLTSRHVLVAGGGGSSKTGVANGFVCKFLFFEYICDICDSKTIFPLSLPKVICLFFSLAV